MGRKDNEFSPTGTISFQVPPEVCESLKNLQNGRLGSSHTKRYVRTTTDAKDLAYLFPNSDLDLELAKEELAVYMRIAQDLSGSTEDNYLFKIEPQAKVVSVKYWQFGQSPNPKMQEPPSRELFMRELRAAQRVQRTLKR